MARFNRKLTKKELFNIEKGFDKSRIQIAEVMDVRNVSRSGEILVYINNTNFDEKDKKNKKYWVLAQYASPFYGTTPYDTQSGDSYENSPQSFGQWFPLPCVGNKVFVFFPEVSGENTRCYWFACPINPNTNYMIPGIPSKFSDKGKSPKALCDRNDKKFKRTENRKFNNDVALSEEVQAEYKPINKALKRQGLEQDDVRGYSRAGATREIPSMCYGIKTPLGNSFVMDDGWINADIQKSWEYSLLGNNNNGNNEENERELKSGGLSPWQREPNEGLDKRRNAGFRLRTRNGTQILIADEGTVYMINNDGSCWVEMTKNGFLEGYSKKGVAISSDGDINLHTSKNVFIEAENEIAMKAPYINIESDKIDVFNAKEIRTQASLSVVELTAEKGQINTFESVGGKVIGDFEGILRGKAIPNPKYDNKNDIKELKKNLEIEPVDYKDKDSDKVPDEQPKNDTDGKGYSEEEQEKTEQTINTKVTTHEPYCGHCKTCKCNLKFNNQPDEQEEKPKEDITAKDDVSKNIAATVVQNENNCNNCIGKDCNNTITTSSCCGCSSTVTNQSVYTQNKSIIPAKSQNNSELLKTSLGNHLSVNDFCNSSTAKKNNISNIPNTEQIENMKNLSENVLDKLIDNFGDIKIMNGYRSNELNKFMNGNENSEHLQGKCVDIKFNNDVDLKNVVKYINENLDYNELSIENDSSNNKWLHISYDKNNNKKQDLTNFSQ